MKSTLLKRVLTVVFAAACCFSTSQAIAQVQDSKSAASDLKVMSFNIRYGLANDGENSWPKRNGFVADVVKEFAPDLLGLQEAMGLQVEFMKTKLPDWKYFGASRDENPNGEQCGIFIRTERCEVLKDGQFWLSQTPDQKFSKSWDSSLPRIATWVRLRDRTTGRRILFLNTHFDHRGSVARFHAGRIIREFVEEQPKEDSIIVTGDFNCAIKSRPYEALLATDRLQDTWLKMNPTPLPNEGTFNGFQGKDDGARIDWVLCSPNFSIVDADIVKTARDGKYPSDHFPVTAILK